MKVCLEPGCPELTPTRRCPTHTRTRAASQPSTNAKGYGSAHRKLRDTWARRVAQGTVHCWRCGERISPLEPWDLGHDDVDRSVYRGPEHRACNRATSGR